MSEQSLNADRKGIHARSRLTCACILAIAAILLAIAAALLPIIMARRAVSHTSMCKSHIFAPATFVRNYLEYHGSLPPAFVPDETGTTLHSWRVELLRGDYFEYDTSEPWTSLDNRRILAGRFQDAYTCPTDKKALAQSATSYVAVIGNDTFWPGAKPRYLSGDIEQFKDKILFIEISNSGIPWTEPRDISFDEAIEFFSAVRKSGDSPHAGGFKYVTFAAKVQNLSSIETVEEFAEMLRLPKGSYSDSPIRDEIE